MKKIDQNRSVFLKIGFIISISFSILAFNWTVYSNSPEVMEFEITKSPEEFKIMRTIHKKKKVLPPPIVEVSKEIDIDVEDPIFTDTAIVQDVNYPDSIGIKSDTVQAYYGNPKMEPIEPIKIVKPQQEDENVYNELQVEKMPFMGDCYGLEEKEMKQCADLAFLTFMAEHIRYPAFARENGIEGMVHVQFVIGKTGEIEKAEVVRGIGGGCPQEVLRVIGLMPRWSPGIQRGKPVKVRYTAPVNFKLN